MSTFLPEINVNKTMPELKLKQTNDADALKQKIDTGLDRLYSFQHEDGGWGWWQSDESHSFMTAYVVAGLSEARGDGITVKPEVINNGAAWIKKQLVKENNLAPDLRAYLGYALAVAGSKDGAALDESYAGRSS